MGLFAWILLFAGNSLVILWVLRWGGAEWLEGWRAPFFVDWIYAFRWSAEQIKLYALLLWVAYAVLFTVGLLVPEFRFFYG